MRTITLTCLAGPLKDRVFHLDGGPAFIFGRCARAHCNLAADPAASHLHFLIDISGGRVRIADLGSTNGLVVGNRHFGGRRGESFSDFIPIESGEAILAGASLFRLEVREESAETRAAHAARDGGTDALPGPGAERSPDAGGLTAIMPRIAPDSAPEDFVDSLAAALDLDLPKVEGYAVIEKIGCGGKGVVYRAVKDDTGETAAIKMMMFNRDKRNKRRSIETFHREIQITRQLEHPNIIRYLGDGVSRGVPYLALEYVGGGNLDEFIRGSPDGRMDLPQTVPLFIQLLDAVGHMHDRWLVHRDIKPKNILLDRRRGGGRSAKLSDMGLSCRFSNRAADDFLPIVYEGGTPAYMAPEQLTDLTRAIPQSDVFSSAATFYHMLTGTIPYNFAPGRNPNEAVIEGDIRPIGELRPDLPGNVAEFISRALSKNPEHRPANAHEMLAAFRDALG